MRHNLILPVLLIFVAGAVGSIAWSGNILALPLSLAFPAAWAMSPNRTTVLVVSAAYFLAASRGLPQGVAAFYGIDLWPGLLLWLVASVAFVFVHTALWTQREGWERSFRYLTAATSMAIPPFGILGWAHPLTAAGVLFPTLGWTGLAATAAGLAIMTTRHRPAAALAFGGFWLWSAANWTDPTLPTGWYGVDLHDGADLGRDNSLERYRDFSATLREESRPAHEIVLLPESSFGFWTPTLERLWQRQLRGTDLTIVAGASLVDDAGYDNVLVSVTRDSSRILYRERMPVPGSMWQPWRAWTGNSGGAHAYFFANPIVAVGHSSAAPLICYEQLLVWPVLQSMLHDPDLILAVGNGWWASETSIVQIQKASAQAWARLFNKPLVMAFNS